MNSRAAGLRGAGAIALVLALACDPPAALDASVTEAGVDAGPPLDASSDTGVDGGRDAGAAADVRVDDAQIVDAGSDGGCVCPTTPECFTARCERGCLPFPTSGAVCGSGTGICIDGACASGVCGDGHRERGPDPAREGCDDGGGDVGDACSPGCTPTVLIVASHERQDAVPSRHAVASDGRGELLFVWASARGEDVSVQGRRFSAAGIARDPHDTPLELRGGLLPGWRADPVVAGLAGGGWVAAWADPLGDGDQSGILYRIVRPDGTLGALRVAHAETRGSQLEPAIATNGEGITLAWTDESLLGSSRVVVRELAADGRPLAVEESVSDAIARQPALASAGAQTIVAWTEESESGGSRVMARRLGVDATGIAVADGAEPAVSALSDGTFAVAWVDRSADHLGDVRARVVAASGDPLLGSMVISIAGTDGRAELSPNVGALSGGEYLVAYEDGGRRRGVALGHVGSSSLAPETSELSGSLMAGLQGDATLLATSRGLWVAWSDDGALGDPAAYRSFLAFLLPVD